MSVRPFRFGVIGIQPEADLRGWIAKATRAERLGYATLQLTDHFSRSPVAPLAMLARLAAETTHLTLGTLVLDNDFRHPAVLAKELATLELITAGRLEVGMGAGWMLDDYEVSGIEYEPASRRIAKLDESLQILDLVLAGGPATFAGAHYCVRDLTSVPRPSTRPRLLVGGGAPRILGIAARRADIVSVNWNVGEGRVGDEAVRSGAMNATAAKVDVVRRAAGERFGSIELHLVAYWCAITHDPETAVARMISVRGVDVDPTLVLDSPHCLVGTTDQISDRLLLLRERLGFSYISVYDTEMDDFAPVVARLAGR